MSRTTPVEWSVSMYRDRLKGMRILLSRTQAGAGRTVKQEHEQTSRNHGKITSRNMICWIRNLFKRDKPFNRSLYVFIHQIDFGFWFGRCLMIFSAVRRSGVKSNQGCDFLVELFRHWSLQRGRITSINKSDWRFGRKVKRSIVHPIEDLKEKWKYRLFYVF